jgi:polyhydroxyalkanoate synthesis regulator phasin
MRPTGSDQKDSRRGDDPPVEEREGTSFFFKAFESLVPDVVRKTVLLGLGGVSMTEESVRRLISEWRLPREEARRFLDYLVEQSQRSKGEILSLVSAEFKGFLRTLNLEEQFRRILAEMRIRIQADITFERREDGAWKPELGLRVASAEPEPQRRASVKERKSGSGRRKPAPRDRSGDGSS